MKLNRFLVSSAAFGLLAVAAGCTGSIGDGADPSAGTTGGTGSTGVGTGGSTGPGGTGTTTTGGVTTGGSTGTGTTTGGMCEPAVLPTRIWRLNDKQYMKAAADLVPNATVPPISTPGRDPNEFVSFDDQLPVQDSFAAQLSDAAYKMAALAAQNLTIAGNTLVTCAAGQVDRDCAQAFVDKFATRAFHRPLAPEERTGLMAVYDSGVKNGTGFGSGIELVIATVLQAPSFLYRTELGAGGAPGSTVSLTPFEIASSISFLLTNSLPDAELWQTAVDGTLAKADVLAREVDRLLAVAAVQDNLTNVFLSWLGGQQVLTIEKTMDERGTVTFDDPLRQSMFAETKAFTADVLWKGGTVADLFQSNRAFVDKTMATFYGITYSGQGTIQTQMPANRSGLLTRAGLITSVRYGHNPEVFRGQLLRMKVLCGDIPPPPPTVNVDAFNAQYGGLSTRQRIAARASQPSCGTCHQYMDTLGIAYDNFGAVGQPVTQVNGVPPGPAGQLTRTDVDGAFADVLELSKKLAVSEVVKQCMARQMITYAVGRKLAPVTELSCPDSDVAKAIDDSGGRASVVFRGIALNPVFTTRVVGGP